jgi:hypothetical protein
MSYESKNTLKKIILTLLLATLCFALIACNGETPDNYTDDGNESTDGETPDKEEGACDHLFGSWITKTAPSCTENGFEERICEKCNEKESRESSAIDHTYSVTDAVWTWNGTQSAIAELTCQNDSSHKLVLNATVQKAYTDRTCTTDAFDSYTASVAYGNATISDTVTLYYPNTAGCDYDFASASWSWNNNYSKATFTVKCKSDHDEYYGKNRNPHKHAADALRINIHEEIRINKGSGGCGNEDRGVELQDHSLDKKEYRISQGKTDGSYGIIPLSLLALIEEEPIGNVHNGKNDVEKKTSDTPVELGIASRSSGKHEIEHKEGQKYTEYSDKLEQGRCAYIAVFLFLYRLNEPRDHNAEAKEITEVSEVHVEIPTYRADVVEDSEARNTAYNTECAIYGLVDKLCCSVFYHKKFSV